MALRTVVFVASAGAGLLLTGCAETDAKLSSSSSTEVTTAVPSEDPASTTEGPEPESTKDPASTTEGPEPETTKAGASTTPTTPTPAVSTTPIPTTTSATTTTMKPETSTTTLAPSETVALKSQEKGLCLEPAGPLEGLCSFHDTGLDFKQSLRFAECTEGSLDQQWIVAPSSWGVQLKPAKDQSYCMTVPGPYYGSVIDPENHGDFEVWLCQCDHTSDIDPDNGVETDLSWNGTMLGYGDDSSSYKLGYDNQKMSQCYDADGDPNPDAPTCEGIHWSTTSGGAIDSTLVV